MVLKGVRDKNQQKSEIRKYAILSQPRNVTSFEDEIFQLFSYLYGSKVPIFHYGKKLKTSGKLLKIPYLQLPD